MIDWIGGGWIVGEVTGSSTWFADLTLEVPQGDVLAVAAVSDLWIRVDDPDPGSVAVYVREYAQADASGKPHIVDVAADPTRDVLAIASCIFVRFRMTLYRASAASQGLVFHQAAGTSGGFGPTWTVRDYRISAGRDELGMHRVMALARGSAIDVDRVLGRSAAEAARHFGLRSREVRVVPRRARSRRQTAERPHVF